MRMRDQHLVKRGLALTKMPGDIGEVIRPAHAGIDERGTLVASDNQICVVAAARHRARVVRVDQNRVEHRCRPGIQIRRPSRNCI